MDYELARCTYSSGNVYTQNGRLVFNLTAKVNTTVNSYDEIIRNLPAIRANMVALNFFDVTIDGNTVVFADGNRIELPENIIEKLGGKKDGLILGIRGEDIKLDAQNLDVFGSSKQSAVVENTEIMGTENNLYFTFGGAQTIARVSKYEISGIGDKIEFVFMPSKIHFFDKESEICLV